MAKNTWYTRATIRKIKLKGGGRTTRVIQAHQNKRRPPK
jgi:hypothetical protein